MNLSERQISMVITAVENTVREWERAESSFALPATLVAEQVAEWTKLANALYAEWEAMV
jgi:hypothetical protein